MTRVAAIAIVCLAWTCLATRVARAVDPAVLAAEQARVDAIESVRPTVLAVFPAAGEGGGSGVVISPDGYALTNFHVVSGSGSHFKCGMADGKLYDAVLVGLDPTGDIAVLKLFGRDDFPAARMGDSDTLRAGDEALVLGNPFLLATDYQPTVTYGIISGVHRYQYPAGTVLEYGDCIQTDASINPGNSGGPLFNGAGELVGINGRGSFEKRGRVNVGVGYAISINQIKNFLGQLKGGLIVDHATLGAVVSTDLDGRVIVTDILPDSDAYRRGLRYGDEIVSFAGRTITTVNAFKNALAIFPQGWRLPLSYRRDGRRHDTLVRLRAAHAQGELAELAGKQAEVPAPRPKPDDEPRSPTPDEHDHQEGDRPAEDTPRPKLPPRLMPVQPGPKKPPLPEIIRQHLVERRGYANAYFNKLNLDRVWNAFLASGSFEGAAGLWTIDGEMEGGGGVRLQLDEVSVRATVPAGETSLAAADDLSQALDPPGSGGLLAALHLWRRLLTQGPGDFGALHYDGAAPVLGSANLAEVLRGTYANVEVTFAFDPTDGRLLALEMFPANDVDPCELYFSDYREFDGRRLPGRIEVRHGDEVYAVLLPETYRLEAASADAKAQEVP
ncbi:MAG: trypsin-like peptidase domain-containing protein [Pirellulales bacterium]|nr:trypsin-like peptidase domain-containing protein [Pirellulales bacterium]